MMDVQKIYSSLCSQDMRAAQAHAEMLKVAEVLTEAEYAAICEEFDALRTELQSVSEDNYSWLDMCLDERIPELAQKLEYGRSLEDRHALVMRLTCKEMIVELCDRARELMTAFTDKAQGNLGLPMPVQDEYSAEDSILLSHYLLSYVWMLQRDLRRLRAAHEEADVNPLGSGAYAGVCGTIDRQMTTELLELSMPIANSVDAVSDRDFLLSFVQSCQIFTAHLMRFFSTYLSWSYMGWLDELEGLAERHARFDAQAEQLSSMLAEYVDYLSSAALTAAPHYTQDRSLLTHAYVLTRDCTDELLKLVSGLYIRQDVLESQGDSTAIQEFTSFGGTAHKQVSEQLVLAQNQIRMEEFYRERLS